MRGPPACVPRTILLAVSHACALLPGSSGPQAHGQPRASHEEGRSWSLAWEMLLDCAAAHAVMPGPAPRSPDRHPCRCRGGPDACHVAAGRMADMLACSPAGACAGEWARVPPNDACLDTHSPSPVHAGGHA